MVPPWDAFKSLKIFIGAGCSLGVRGIVSGTTNQDLNWVVDTCNLGFAKYIQPNFPLNT